MRVAGVMSGTSLDGIDVAIVDVTGRGWTTKLNTVAHRTTRYPPAVRQALLSVSNTDTHTAEIARLHFLLGHLYADAIEKACQQANVPISSLQLVGCHGQTIFHEGNPRPVLGRRIASTLQIGEGGMIAERLGLPVVSDFRPRDLAAGGGGAPLVPYFDYLMFRHRRRGRVALNIGGIANITAIPPGAMPDQVFAFDTGPGNMVMDAILSDATGGKQTYDRGGRIGRGGQPDHPRVRQLLRHPYYRRKPPKTAGREEYGTEFVASLKRSALSLPDLVATAAELTVQSIALAISRFVQPNMAVGDLIAAGGGTHNPVIMRGLRDALPGMNVTTTAEFGIDPDAKEAIAFALFAYETWHGRPSNLPSATGASHPVVLGKLTR